MPIQYMLQMRLNQLKKTENQIGGGKKNIQKNDQDFEKSLLKKIRSKKTGIREATLWRWASTNYRAVSKMQQFHYLSCLTGCSLK